MKQPTPAAAAMATAFACYERGQLKAAERRYREALGLDPRSSVAHNCLGVTIAAQGRVGEAIEHFRTAFELDPRAIPAAMNLADAALNLDRLEEARETLETVLPAASSSAQVHALMAETLAALGRPREALASTSRWAALAPGDSEAHRAHAMVAQRVGEHAAALAALRRARALDAGTELEQADLRGIAASLEYARFDAPDREAERELTECLRAGGIESQTLARAAGDLLCAKYRLGETPGDLTLEAWAKRGWPDDALLLALLERAINVDPRIERVLIAQRRLLLCAFAETGRLPKPWRRATAAMATQCFLNEHAWRLDSAEHERAVDLTRRLESLSIPGDADDLADLLIAVGLCSSLAKLANATAIDSTLDWPATLGPLVELALREPLVERELARDIPRTHIADAVSAAVRAQYEESPYPRWVDLPVANPQPLAQQLADQFPAFRATAALEPPHRILIAGCGSGRHPLRVGRGSPEASILAIDLSIASLAYALRRARELSVSNVEFRQLDILDARDLDGDFAVIETSGVLHHMRDPGAGLAALVDKLRPGGAMKIGLYSRRARRLVTLARERIAAHRLDASPEAMREFRACVLDGEIEGLEALADSSDVYALSACRDLLFHVQEHQFSPLEIGALLERHGLRFLGFQLPSYRILERYRDRFPHDETLNDLACWDEFEAAHPGTFANTFQLWCQKPD